MKTLFLDFDGVLHPSIAILGKDIATLALHGSEHILASGLFKWNELLEAALSESEEEVVIVVHSSWRNQPWMSTSLARDLLGPLAHRFEGFVELREPREKAISEFADRMKVDDFLILDDSRAEFSVLLDRLLLTNPLSGVSEASTLAQIRAWTSAKSDQMPRSSCVA